MAVPGGQPLPARSAWRPFAWAAVALLGVGLVVGALFFWLGVPMLVLWTLSKLTDSSTTHFVLGMVCVPTGMALFAVLLTWLNRLYLRATALLREDGRVDGQRRSEGPLVPLLVSAAVLSLIALLLWFFALAHSSFPAAPGSL